MIGLATRGLLLAQGAETSAGEPSSPWDAGGLLEIWNSWSPLTRTALALVIFFTVFGIFRRLIVKRLERAASRTENDLDDRVVHFVRQFYGIGMFFLLLLWLLRIWGIEITPLLAGAGIVGISLGFAAKEFIADVLAGVFLITDRPMATGDRVNVERIGSDWGSWGDVVDIGLRRTQIRNTDGVVVNYPNAILSNSVITNFSHTTDPIRVRVRFAVSLDSDLEEAMEVTRKAVEGTDGVLPDSANVVLRSIWDQQRGVLLRGALLEARYRIADIRTRTQVRSRVLLAVVRALREAEISIPRGFEAANLPEDPPSGGARS